MARNMARGMETINISKASTLTNLFYLFFHGGKAAIMPFLTLFFRLIGLNALEVGIIMAAKTLTGLIWAPLWSRCATAYNRHRSVMMFSLVMMIAMYLSLVGLYTQISKPEHCLSQAGGNSSSTEPILMSTLSTTPSSLDTETLTSIITADYNKSVLASISTTEKPEVTTLKENITVNVTVSVTNNQVNGTLPSEMFEKNSLSSSAVDMLFLKSINVFKHLNISAQEMKNLTVGKVLDIIKEQTNYTAELNDEELVQFSKKLTDLTESDKDVKASDNDIVKRPKRNDWTDIELLKGKLHTIQSSLKTDKLLLFLVILAIIVLGEIFSSPVEKLADDSWFDFLNRIDDLERYGQQRFWGSIAFVLVPVIVTVTVDHSPCFLFGEMHHFLIHFYTFAVLMVSAWMISCCYPAPPPANAKHSAKIAKSLKIICCDSRGFLFSVTLLLTGLIYASYYNFLFWRIQDLGGKETIMGLCVTIGAFAEIPMLILSSRLVKKLGPVWLVSLSMLVLSLRVLLYGFITEPWAFLPIELSHGITHTAMWFAILSYDDFNMGSSVDRSLRAILSSFYFGVGFSSGSLLSGFIYHTYGYSILFWGGSAVIAGWCILFSLLQKCLPKKQNVKYVKLLKSESDNSDDDEEDWLEMALKDH